MFSQKKDMLAIQGEVLPLGKWNSVRMNTQISIYFCTHAHTMHRHTKHTQDIFWLGKKYSLRSLCILTHTHTHTHKYEFKTKGSLLFPLFYKRYVRTNIPPFSDVIS